MIDKAASGIHSTIRDKKYHCKILRLEAIVGICSSSMFQYDHKDTSDVNILDRKRIHNF